MWVTPRDLEILARVHSARACDSASLADLFPTARALHQRLWRLTREGFLAIHRIGNQRAYSLGRRGAQSLGLSASEIRVSRATAIQSLLYAQVRRKLQTEGYVLNGQDQVGRTMVLRAWHEGRGIAVAVCDPEASLRAMRAKVDRLLSLVNPFEPIVDELMVFGAVPSLLSRARLPVAQRERVSFHSLRS